MGHVAAHGIRASLPAFFEARIFKRTHADGARGYPVAHFATFPLPAEIADFGGGVPTTMGAGDIFAVLFEYGPESVGTPLFARQGMPRAFSSEHFRPYLLRRGVAGQSGTQWFFTEAGRAFTFYAVLGSHARRSTLVARVNELVRGVSIAVPGSAPGSADAGPSGGG